MKTKAKAEQWEETDRQPIGATTGYGRGKTMPWFSIIYRVTEAQMQRGRVVGYRERVTYGKELNVAAVPELAGGALLAIVAEGADTLSRYAATLDERATSRHKAR